MKRSKHVQAARLVLAELGSTQRILARIALSFGLGLLFLWLLSARVQDMDLDHLRKSVFLMSWGDWLAATGCTAIAFWAVGHYDALLHRHFVTKVDSKRAKRAGICAISVSQSLGLGVVTGAILRWRMLPEQPLMVASKITLAVALSFLAGWAVVTAAVVLAMGDGPYKDMAVLVIVLAAAAVALSLYAPKARFRWPNIVTIAGLMFFCAVDCFAAAFGFFIFLPADIGITFLAILPGFLMAYGAGLISGAPGGIGAFEVTLLALLPHLPHEAVLAAIIAWRLIYFVLPAMIGAVVAIMGPEHADPAPMERLHFPRQGRRAETGILAQGEHDLIGADGRAVWLIGRCNHVLVGLFDPMQPDCDAIGLLAKAAKSEARWPLIYKASAPLAVVARRAGWIVWRHASEAVIDPGIYTLAHPRRAGLRRKLRHANHVVVLQLDHGHPWGELDQINAQWAQSHGGERGFSMGRYGRDYVAQQRLYIAYVNGQAQAFITLHETGAEWTLDLMRHRADIPDGTMHMLVHSAIQDAARLGVARLSLAAVPQTAFVKLPKVLHRWTDAGHGLRRFKDSFLPKWEARYVIAPHWRAGLIGAISLIGAIAGRRRDDSGKLVQSVDDSQYGFAPNGFAWQRDKDI